MRKFYILLFGNILLLLLLSLVEVSSGFIKELDNKSHLLSKWFYTSCMIKLRMIKSHLLSYSVFFLQF